MSESYSLATEPEGVVASLLERFNSSKVSAMMTLYEPGPYSSRETGRLVDVEAAGEWDDLAYLNAVDVGRDGGAPAPRKRPSTS